MVNINEFPFPKRRSGWTAALVLTLLCFLLYYSCLYNDLFNFHYYNEREIPVLFGEYCKYKDSKYTNLLITFSYPKYITNYANVTSNIRIKNKNTQEFKEDRINLSISLPVKQEEEGKVQRTIKLEGVLTGVNLNSNEEVKGVFPITFVESSPPEMNDDDSSISINGETINFPSSIQPESSTVYPLIDSIIGLILLPPASNQIIPLIVIFFCYLFEIKEST